MVGELAEIKSLNLAYAQRIEKLLRSLGKNNRNSGMPPSSGSLSKPTVEEIFNSARGTCAASRIAIQAVSRGIRVGPCG